MQRTDDKKVSNINIISKPLLFCNHGNFRPTLSHSPSMTWLRNLVAEGCSSLQPDSCISRSTVWLQRHSKRERGRKADKVSLTHRHRRGEIQESKGYIKGIRPLIFSYLPPFGVPDEKIDTILSTVCAVTRKELRLALYFFFFCCCLLASMLLAVYIQFI